MLQAELDFLVSDVPIVSASLPWPTSLFVCLFVLHKGEALKHYRMPTTFLGEAFDFPRGPEPVHGAPMHRWRQQPTPEHCLGAGWDPLAESVHSGSVSTGQPMWWQAELKKSQVQLCRVIGRQELSEESLPGGETQVPVTFLTHYYTKELRTDWHNQCWVRARKAAPWTWWTSYRSCNNSAKPRSGLSCHSLCSPGGKFWELGKEQPAHPASDRHGRTHMLWLQVWLQTNFVPFYVKQAIYLEGWSGGKTETDREVFGTVKRTGMFHAFLKGRAGSLARAGQPIFTQHRLISMKIYFNKLEPVARALLLGQPRSSSVQGAWQWWQQGEEGYKGPGCCQLPPSNQVERARSSSPPHSKQQGAGVHESARKFNSLPAILHILPRFWVAQKLLMDGQAVQTDVLQLLVCSQRRLPAIIPVRRQMTMKSLGRPTSEVSSGKFIHKGSIQLGFFSS